jgi:hypothetical protein
MRTFGEYERALNHNATGTETFHSCVWGINYRRLTDIDTVNACSNFKQNEND